MAKTKTTTIRAKNQITGQVKWFTEATWKRIASMPRLYKGKNYPSQGWVRIAEQKAPEPDAAKEAAKAKAEAEAKAAKEADAKKQAKAAAAEAAKEANAPKATAPKKGK